MAIAVMTIGAGSTPAEAAKAKVQRRQLQLDDRLPR
jgi:hypothetical protein